MGVSGLAGFLRERFSGASVWDSSTSKSGSGLVVVSGGDGLGTDVVCGWVLKGDNCRLRFMSSGSESDSSSVQSSVLNLGLFVTEIKK